MIGFLPIFSESYNLEVDEHSYDLEYDINANVLAMAIDHELNSLLIGIDNTHDSKFTITLPNEMISAENNEFAVLVDGYEVDYELHSLSDDIQILFFVPTDTQEIEIIGTHVIPEFPFSILVLLILMTSTIILTRKYGFTN